MAEFKVRWHNRLKFPTKHILVVEDDIDNQVNFAKWARRHFEPQGLVQFDFVCSGVVAGMIITNMHPNLVILDHDLPIGNGSDLIEWLAETGQKIPIITASGIPENNQHMLDLCNKFGIEVYHYLKREIYEESRPEVLSVIEEILKREDANQIG